MVEPENGASPLRRCGFIALIGAPNVGKSTLINAIVGAKVAIVSHKVQTTRTLLRGIATQEDAQLVFIDTPGIFQPRRRLDRAMVAGAWTGAGDADIVGAMIDAKRGLDEETSALLERLAGLQQPKILIVNKIDLVEKPTLLTLVKNAIERVPFAATFMVSALTGDGIADLKHWLSGHVPVGPWHYPEDQLTDAPLRQLAAEITREKLYLRLHQELPYQSTVETNSWKELKDGSVRIEQTIYRGAHEPAQDRPRQGRADHQGDRCRSAARDRRHRRAAGAPVLVRQGARGLGRRPGALPRDRARVSQRMTPAT